ncbi:MAG: response regulator transcription factor, partial [Nitrospirota bacterium]
MNNNGSGKTKKKYKVLIVDDHPIVRQGLSMMINQENDLHICGEASDIASALESVKACRPDIVVVDISLGQSSGLTLIEELTRHYNDISVLALSMHDETLYAERCLRAGAKGYIMK